MTQEEILDYNKLCAEFLGFVNTTHTDKDFSIYQNEKGMIIGNKIYTMIEPMSAKFHSDWNWIMEVVEAIEKLENVRVKQLQNSCDIFIIDKDKLITLTKQSKKEATVQAINQFLIWYNENKTKKDNLL